MSKRSIISLHIGQCGIQMGSSVWELYNFEHDIQNDGSRDIPADSDLGSNLDNYQTFYYETASGHYVPRALFIDSEPSVMDSLRQSSLGAIFHPSYMINNNQDCRNLMGLAWYPTFCGQPFHDKIRKQVRKLREISDSLSGVMYHLSTCGGTGTGFTCRTLEHMKNVCDSKSVNYAVAVGPSVTISSNPLETLNTMGYLGLTRFDNLAMNMHTMYDNEALYRQCNRLLGSNFSPTYKNLNQLIAMATSSVTASLRFDGQLNVDLNEFQTNLIPIPTLNTMYNSMAPLNMDERKELVSTRDITLQCMEPEAFMCSVSPWEFANRWTEDENEETWPLQPWDKEAEEIAAELDAQLVLKDPNKHTMNHKFIAACVMYRGDLMPATINRAMQALTEEKNPQFVQWVPCGFKVGINSPPMRTPVSWPFADMSRSVTCVQNNTVICEKLKQLLRNYRHMGEISIYDVWSGIGGLEGNLLDGIRGGIADTISQYEYCMATKIPISEIKEKLHERPQALGKF